VSSASKSVSKPLAYQKGRATLAMRREGSGEEYGLAAPVALAGETGLCYHPLINAEDKFAKGFYRVTHVKSGRVVTQGLFKADTDARAFIQAIQGVTDWDKPKAWYDKLPESEREVILTCLESQYIKVTGKET